MLMPGEVGARITERDRQLRNRQKQHAHNTHSRHHSDMEPCVRIFGDVAYEGGLYSPLKKKGLYYEEVDEEDMPVVREESPQEVNDEELLYYDR